MAGIYIFIPRETEMCDFHKSTLMSARVVNNTREAGSGSQAQRPWDEVSACHTHGLQRV